MPNISAKLHRFCLENKTLLRMYHKIKHIIEHFWHIEEKDISDRYMLVTLIVFIFFLFTQVISNFFVTINVANSILTLLSLFLLIGFLYLFQSKKHRFLSKILFVFVTHILIFVFWITSDGLLGAIPTLIPILAFIVVAIMPHQYAFKTLIFSLFFCTFLIVSDFLFPASITPYQSLAARKTDIIVSIYFTLLFVSFSFMYLKKQYHVKEIALQKEYDAQIRLNEELDHFVYRTSHDLRAPISSTLGLITLIRMSKNIDEILKYVNLQEKSLLKMDGFIHDILSYSQNNRVEIIYEKIDFKSLYEDTIESLQEETRQHIVQTNLIFDANKDYILDKPRLQTIFKNLISNAFRYHDPQKETAFLNIKIKEDTHFITIAFEDNGIGIPKDCVPKVFDMFYRAHRTSVGSGVGLYITKQSAEKLGGNIICISQEFIGTTFVITLPKKEMK